MASVANVGKSTPGSSSDPLTLSLTVSAGTGRVAVLVDLLEATRTYTAVTFNGNAMTQIDAASIIHASTVPVANMWYYDIPDVLGAGSYTISVDRSSGSSDSQLYAWQLSGVSTGGPEDADEAQVASSAATTITRTLTCTNGAVLVAAVIDNDPTQTIAWSGDSGITERDEGNETNFTTSVADVVVSGAGDKVVTATMTTNAGRKLLIAASWAAVVGPTVTVQPTAQTARINGETAPTATFTVAATGTGGLTYDWELETSVGGGSYSNLADGSGATWTGQAASSCVGTFTAKTLSGRRVRCNVTDSNGTTTTNAVTLTVLDGPVLSASSATTNGSGVASVTMTSDDALSANGEILLVTATVRGQVVARTTVRPA